MAKFEITSPDGTRYEVEGPEGSTEEDALAQVQAQQTRKSTLQSVGGTLRDIGLGAVKGASRIGDTILSARDAAESGIAKMMGVNVREEDRAAKIDKFMRDQGADTESLSYAGGDLGAQIAGTAAVGGVLGQGAKALGFSRLGQALTTGGATTGAKVARGVMPTAANVGIRLAGGGIGGGAAAGMVGDDVGTGAAFGAALPLPMQAAGKVFQRFAGGKTNAAGALLNKAAGDDQAAIMAALQNHVDSIPGSVANVGEAAVGVGNTRVAALQKIAKGSASKEYLAADIAAEHARLKILTDIAKTPAEYAAAKAELDAFAKKALGELYKQADIAGELLPRLQGRADNLSAAAADRVQKVRAMNAAAGRAEDMGTEFGRRTIVGPERVATGMPSVGKQYSYGQELANRAEGVGTNAAAESLTLGEGARRAQQQISAVERSRFKPINIQPISDRVDEMLNAEGDRIVTLNQNVLGQFKDKLAEAVRLGNGQPKARDLHALRKSEINAIVDSLSKSPDDGIKRRAAGLVAQLKDQIDDAIEAAGATGWRKNFIEPYSAKSGNLEEMKLGKRLSESLQPALGATERQASFAAALRKAENDISPYTGKPLIDELSFANRNKINTLDLQNIRDAKFDRQAAAGMKEAASLLSTETRNLNLPNTLNVATTWTNRLLDVVQHKASEKTLNELARLMQNPKETARVMSMVGPNEQNVLRKLMATRYVANVSGESE